jgi:phosphoenolpyruvate synthase/pyruvate phosphate dikinase
MHGPQFAMAHPEFYRAQLQRLILYYSSDYTPRKNGVRPPMEVMVPGIRNASELSFVRGLYNEVLEHPDARREWFSFGAMLETCDALKNVDSIAPLVDFVSFGLNDLSSEITGCPRGGREHTDWVIAHHGYDPTREISPNVMAAVEDTLKKLRAINPIKADLCGYHATLPEVLDWAHRIGIDGVSIAPVPEIFLDAKLGAKLRAFQTKMPDTDVVKLLGLRAQPA